MYVPRIAKILETKFEIIDLLISEKILNSWENKSLNSWENTFKFYCNLQLKSYFHKINWKLGKATRQQTHRYHGDITFECIPFDLFIAKLHAYGINENYPSFHLLLPKTHKIDATKNLFQRRGTFLEFFLFYFAIFWY